MPDPVTTSIVTLAAAHVLRESFTAVVKPTADYFGVELKQYTESQVQRIRQIASSLRRKLGERTQQDSAVNPRVFRKVIDEGYLCPDSISAEYYGGFLASSHSQCGKDDTNVPFVSLVNGMSSDQLHGHWILYAILFNWMYGRDDLGPYHRDARRKAALYIPWPSFMFLFETLRVDDIEDSMPKFRFSGSGRSHSATVCEDLARKPLKFDLRRIDLDPRRLDVVSWGILTHKLVDHIYWGLTGWDLAHRIREDYPSAPLNFGPKEISGEQLSKILDAGGKCSDETSVDKGGIVFWPSILGMDLFLRAQGLPPEGLISFKSLSYEFYPEQFRKELMENVSLVDLSPSPRGARTSRPVRPEP